MISRVLVTGCSGFMGAAVVKRLSGCEHSICGLDIAAPGYDMPNFQFKECDILDCRSVKKVVSQFAPEFVIHLAARIDLDGAQLGDYAANIAGVENLVTAIAQTDTIKKTVFTSSQLVCPVNYVPKHDTDYCPATLYGESKVLTEEIVRKHNGGGRPWCIARPTTIWGPGMSPHYQRLFRMIESGKYFHVGKGKLLKSYGYIGNAAAQYSKLLQAPESQIDGNVFYIADYEPISLREWTDLFALELNVPKPRTLPLGVAKSLAHAGDLINLLGWKGFPFNSFRLNNVLTEYQFDLSNTEAVCGALPYTVNQGVSETVSWLLESGIIGSST